MSNQAATISAGERIGIDTGTAEKHTVDGISYTVHRNCNGSTVDSPCACFGSLMRCHSTAACPWLAKR